MKRIFSVCIVLILGAMLVQACELPTTSLSDARICDNLDGDECAQDMQIISTDATAIYLSAQLDNAPEGTSVTYTLTDSATGEVLSTNTWTAQEGGGGPFSLHWNRPDEGWVPGEYELTLALGEDDPEPINKVFEIR